MTRSFGSALCAAALFLFVGNIALSQEDQQDQRRGGQRQGAAAQQDTDQDTAQGQGQQRGQLGQGQGQQRGQFGQGQQRGQFGQGQQRGQFGQRQGGLGGGQEQRADSYLARWLIVDNQGEVELGKVAQQRASNDRVKEFAQRMVREHGDYIQKLQRYAGGAFPTANGSQRGGQQGRPFQRGGQDQGAGGRREQETSTTDDRTATATVIQDQGQSRGGNLVQRTDENQVGQRAGGGVSTNARAGGAAGQAYGQGAQGQMASQRGGNLLQIKQQIGQRKVQLTRKELEKKQGTEFDKAYMGQQEVAHITQLATLEVFREHASSEFQQVIDQGIQTSRKHLEHAREICQELEGREGSGQRSGQGRGQQSERQSQDNQ